MLAQHKSTHNTHHNALSVVLNLRQGQVVVKLVFVNTRVVGAAGSNESSASSSASELARTLEDETDSLFRFLGTVVPRTRGVAELQLLPATSEAGPDASAGAETLFL